MTTNTSIHFFWEALEASLVFELFLVTHAPKHRFRFGIHKATGAMGMIRFFPYEGEWGKEEGLVVRLSFETTLYGGYDVPRAAKLALQNYPNAKPVSATHEKSFLPDEVEWAITRLDASVLRNSEGAHPYEWSDRADPVIKEIQGKRFGR